MHAGALGTDMSDKVEWLAGQIFKAFPSEVSGLKFSILDCGCIYYQVVSEDGRLYPEAGVYREGKKGPCSVCKLQAINWRQMVSDVVVVYNIRLEVEMDDDGSD